MTGSQRLSWQINSVLTDIRTQTVQAGQQLLDGLLVAVHFPVTTDEELTTHVG